jgi:hypothetical protein
VQVTMTSVARRVNQDFTGAGPAAAVVIDGAGIPGGEAVCRHGVAWYATRLGGTLLALLSLRPDRTLPAVLAEAVELVTDGHRATCDVTDPISPSAAVAVLRVRDGVAEHLVLGDAVLVLGVRDGAPVVVTDTREVEIARPYEIALRDVPPGSDEHQRLLRDLRAHRNRPGGFWVAKDDPRAAAEAVTGSRPVSGLTGAALLSNGASRFVDRFGLTGWPGLLALLAAAGPEEIIRRVRDAERQHGVAPDDATIAWCTGL